MDKLQNKLLKVPYVHCVFTLPHQLNGLAKSNPSLIYSMILKASWMTVQQVMKRINAKAGMSLVLHTFGSDLKYHIHVHALVTFGGLDQNGKWVFPLDKYKIARYREMCSGFKRAFLELLKKEYESGHINYHETFEQVEKDVKRLRWIVHSTHPTIDPQLITNYLGRYINRIAVSKQRIKLLQDSKEVILLYNDYKNQQKDQPPPKAIRHLDPLVAIDQILTHVLPRHFQKSRHVGLHKASNKLKQKASEALLNNVKIIRTVFQIITHLLGMEKMKCIKCNSELFDVTKIYACKEYAQQFINKVNKSPPIRKEILPDDCGVL